MSTVFLREVPGASPVHRLWAGTKIVGALAVSLLLVVLPTWPTLGVVAAFLVGAAVVAGIPPGAVPRLSWWFWGLIVVGGVFNALSGVDPLLRYVQATVLGALMFVGAMVVAWTTPMNQIAPAVATLAAPLRKLRLPVDEWATAIALCLRSLPLLIEEMRVLRAARRLRPRDLAAYRDRHEHPLVDVITATMSVSLRRAAELGEAISARGGTGQLAAYPARPGRADAVAFAIIALVVALGAVLGILTL